MSWTDICTNCMDLINQDYEIPNKVVLMITKRRAMISLENSDYTSWANCIWPRVDTDAAWCPEKSCLFFTAMPSEDAEEETLGEFMKLLGEAFIETDFLVGSELETQM